MTMRALAAISIALLVAANAQAQLQAPRWQLTRDLVIRGDAAELDVVTGITIGPDGAVYATQPRRNLIKVFESDGRLRGVVGGRGAGPGEFFSLSALGWIGDTLWVVDGMQRRAVFLDSRGRHLRTVPNPAFIPVALLSGGRQLTRQAYPDASSTTERLAIQSADGASRTVIDYRAVPDVLEIEKGVYLRNFFADNPMLAVCPGSARFVVVEARAPEGDSAAYTVRRFSADGSALGPVIAGNVRAQPMPANFVDSVQRSVAAGYIRSGRISESDYLAIVHRAVPQRRLNRAFDSAVCADNGDVWLRLAGRGSAWVVLDASNAFNKAVDLPPHAELGYAAGALVWLIQRDEFDVPSLVRYKLAQAK